MAPLVLEPTNIDDLLREKVRKDGMESLTARERKWYHVMRERERAARRGYVRSNYTARQTIAPTPPPPAPRVASSEVARQNLNRRLKNTLRRAKSAERRQNRRSQRQIWQQLANIGQEYQRQGRRYSERMRELKEELGAEAAAPAPPAPRVAEPLPIQYKPGYAPPPEAPYMGPRPMLPVLRGTPPSEESMYNAYEDENYNPVLGPLRGGRRRRKSRGRK
jgi:hypothetical protein